MTLRTEYVGQSTLVLSSPGRAPDQDAPMAVGYAMLFNEPATVDRLRASAGLPADVAFEARTVAASPIMTIEATADNPATAQDAAQAMAEHFRDDINSAHRGGTDKAIVDLEGQLDALTAQPEATGSANPLVPVLQDRIETIKADSTNQLQDLALRAGVTEIKPALKLHLVVGALGGLLLGVLAAVGLSALSTRLTNSADVAETGVRPLVEVPDAGSPEGARLREERMRALANLVSLEDLPKSPVVALADSRGATRAAGIALALAEQCAVQGNRTVLVYADNEKTAGMAGVGFNEALADSGIVHSVLQDSKSEYLKVLLPGKPGLQRSLLTRERLGSILDRLRMDADTIIVVAPSVSHPTDAQIVCAAADTTIIAVAKRSSRAGDVKAAVQTLGDGRARVLGAVLTDKGAGPVVASVLDQVESASV